MALNTAPWGNIDGARAQLATMRIILADALTGTAQAQANLAEAQRTLAGSALDPFTQAVTDANTALGSARTNEANARQALAAAIGAWAPTTLSPDDDLKRLPASAPIVMLPIRIETRFGTNAGGVPSLLVRVFPDEIFLNTHETALTAEEVASGKKYFNDTDTEHEQPERWRELVRTMSPERAAYVLRALQPHDPSGSGSLSITFFDAAPGYPPQAPHPGMVFHDVKLRPSQWARPGEAILPDRWVVRLTVGANTRSVNGNPIPEPLAMTPDPSVAPGELIPVPGSNNQLLTDPKLLWTLHYPTAESVGMAITIPLVGNEGTTGFDRVVVYGVKTSMRADAGSKYIEQLLDAHHYTRGLSVVPQGSPTNNTEDQPTPVSHDDPDPDETFHLERDPAPSFTDFHDYRLSMTDDGDYLARALGVPNGAFLNIAGGRTVPLFSGDSSGPGREQERARAAIGLLWEVAFGHFGREMLDWTDDQRTQARDWVTSFVRARGPAPALRIGTVPYGILPAVSLLRWAPRPTTAGETIEATRQGLEQTMLLPLKNLRERWKAAAIGQTPRVTPASTDPSADLMRALALYPSAREARVRTVTGQLYAFHLTSFLGFDFNSVANRIAQAVSGAIQRIGVPQWAAKPVASLVFDAAASRFAGALVAPAASMSETTGLAGSDNYLAVLQTADTQGLFGINGHSLPVTNTNLTLFFRLLVHALILDLTQAAFDLIIQLNIPVTAGVTVDFHHFRFRELISVKVNSANPNTPVPTPRELLSQKVPVELVRAATGLDPNTLLGDYLLTNQVGTVSTFMTNLHTLQNVPTAELERLFTETMDLASHRLDAWLTAFATRRLYLMRARQTIDHQFPTGDYVGGFGYVENLRRAARQTDPATGLTIQPGNGGLIHTPSMSHAAAAGVLRNGHLTHKDEDGQKCAVDLSSARARAAQLVLDELRNGQNLGAVIGYRFERRVQERAQALLGATPPDPTTAGAIESYRLSLRNRFPLVLNKQGTTVTGAVDAFAARNVVDGLLLRNAFKAVPTQVNPVGDIGATAGNIVVQELLALDDLVDGVADLVTAESILHFVRGNTGRAAGTLDALARGARPPESEMVRSVTRGPSLTFGVSLVLNADTPAGGWPTVSTGTSTYRAEVDPILDRWVGGLLGDPTNVACQVSVTKADGTTDKRTVTLADLAYRETRDAGGAPVTRKLRPLDVVALARASAQANQGSLLDRWITSAGITAAGVQAGERLATIDYTRIGAALTFPEAIEVALTISQLLGGARALRPEDLVPPGDLPNRKDELIQAASTGAIALNQTADAAAGFLANAIARLTSAADGPSRRAALENASAFVASAYPASTTTDADLQALADPISGPIVAELQRRQAEATDVGPAFATPPINAVDRALKVLRALYGTETMATFAFSPPGQDELKASFASIAAAFTPDETDDPARFIQGATEIREGLWRWRRLALYSGALGLPRPRLDVAQLPNVPEQRWFGLAFDQEGQEPPPPNGFSPMLYSYGAGPPDPGTPWSGLMLDSWVEVVPQANEETGIAFHYDSPGAEAPQTILVVPPSSVGSPCPNDPTIDGWQANDLAATLAETVDLAKIRTVDAQMVDFGQLFPSIYLSENVQRHVPTTSWLGSLFERIALLRT